MVNEFGRSPTKSYSGLLGGMGSVCVVSAPLDFSHVQDYFGLFGLAF